MATLKITERPQVPALKNGASLLITQQETVNGQPVESLRRIEANPLLAPPIIPTATGSIVTITDGAARPAIEVISHIEPVQEGEGDPSPNNVRPISGWDSVTAYAAGKNLADAQLTSSTTLQAFVYLVAGQTYTLSVAREASGVYFTDGADVNIIYAENFGVNRLTYTAENTGIYRARAYYSDNSASLDCKMQVELGSVATTYEPYQGQTLTATLPETVYGGKYNWTTGVLTNRYVRLVFDGVTKGRMFDATDSSTGGSAYIRLGSLPAAGKPSGIAYSNIATSARIVTAGPILVSLPNSLTGASASDDAATVVSKFNAACAALYEAGTPLEIVYERNTPVTYQLTPQQLDTLHGINNVWSDCADTTLSYIADTELWSKTAATSMIGAAEPSMVASKNYASGDFIVVQNAMALYRATAPIAKGEAIKPGTNCTATTVVEQIAALYSLINR